MKALITGGAGFIGSHLVRSLLSRNYKVIVIDDLSTGNIDWLRGLPISFFQLDIASSRDVKVLTRLALKSTHVDYVFHLAAKASIVPSVKDPLSYNDTNVRGTLNVLELARAIGVKKFIYAASGSCYGIPSEIPTDEYCPVDPQYPYALTKNIGERYVAMWGALYGLPYVSLRLFNVFGPQMCLKGGYGGFFSTILPQKFNQKPVVTIGDGEQRRDFVYVSDVVNALCLAAESDVKNEIYNIGSGTNVSVNEILQLLDITESDVMRLPDRPGEPRETLADISRIKAELGWSPQVSFADGLKDMIADQDYWKSAHVWTYEESVGAQAEWYACFGA